MGVVQSRGDGIGAKLDNLVTSAMLASAVVDVCGREKGKPTGHQLIQSLLRSELVLYKATFSALLSLSSLPTLPYIQGISPVYCQLPYWS